MDKSKWKESIEYELNKGDLLLIEQIVRELVGKLPYGTTRKILLDI
jgi:hypothetical protein